MSDFLNDLQRATIQKLTADGARFDAGGDLRALLQAYYTVKERRIEPRVRSVHRAPEFDVAVAQLNIAEQTAASVIGQKCLAGDDINGHLSLRSLQPDARDELLVDWRIHHLHLSLSPHPSDARFLERSGPLAFGHVTDTDVYLLTILDHGNWSDRNLFEILVRRFPEAVESFELRGVTPDLSITDEVIRACRACGAAYAFPVDGKSYRPPSFAGSNSLSHRAYQRAEQAIREVTKLENAVTLNMQKIISQVPIFSGLGALDLELVVETEEWLVREKTTGQVFRINYDGE
jgi:hypothetical protein